MTARSLSASSRKNTNLPTNTGSRQSLPRRPNRRSQLPARLAASLPVWFISFWLISCSQPEAPSPSNSGKKPVVADAGPADVGQELAERPPYPFVRVLGTAQDGGLPHVACQAEHCQRARRDPSFARRVASLAIVTGPGEVFVIDATPDLPQQLEALTDITQPELGKVDRSPISGVLLTHAHLGHYTGLSFLGFEAVHTQALPVFTTQSMAQYLQSNGPWSQLVTLGNIELLRIEPQTPFRLTEHVEVEAFTVPHRDEFSNTVAFIVRGPRRSMLYVPDTDRWDTWSVPLVERLSQVDIALLDGSFFSATELPGRSIEQIPHPLISTTLGLLAGTGLETKVYFTHFNHSNPAVDPNSAEHQEILKQGFSVLNDGEQFAL